VSKNFDEEKSDRLLEITKKGRTSTVPQTEGGNVNSVRTSVVEDNAQAHTSAIDPLLDAPLEGEFDAWGPPIPLWDELGDMKEWFDLEWFGDNLEYSGMLDGHGL